MLSSPAMRIALLICGKNPVPILKARSANFLLASCVFARKLQCQGGAGNALWWATTLQNMVNLSRMLQLGFRVFDPVRDEKALIQGGDCGILQNRLDFRHRAICIPPQAISRMNVGLVRFPSLTLQIGDGGFRWSGSAASAGIGTWLSFLCSALLAVGSFSVILLSVCEGS